MSNILLPSMNREMSRQPAPAATHMVYNGFKADRAVTTDIVANDIRRHVGHFVLDPYLRLGDTDSVHGVLFGDMAGLGDVAVKPFKNLVRAENEQRNLIRVHEEGFDALEPLQVAVGGLATYLFTARRRDLRHLGQMNWGYNIAARDVDRVVRPTLAKAAITLALWHNAGIYHGDAQAKNLAYGSDGTAVFIDAEKTQFKPSAPLNILLAHKDVGTFGRSVLLGRKLLQDRSPSYRAGFMKSSFLDAYFSEANQAAAPLSAEEQKAHIVQRWIDGMAHGAAPDWTLPVGKKTR